MTENTIHALIKLGKKEHIERLRNEGIIYMNTIDFFKTMEEDEQRKDTEEGLERIAQISWIKMLLGGKEVEFTKNAEKNKLLSAQLKVSNPELNGNIFSMLAITTELL